MIKGYSHKPMGTVALGKMCIRDSTKSFTVTAVGLAMEEGKLSLEDHVAEVSKDKLCLLYTSRCV